jgi:putative (di)nucleoside polyphosphate hydrolase
MKKRLTRYTPAMKSEELLLAEYEQYSEAFWKNEEGGEKRITFFISLTTAIIAAIVALRTKVEIPREEVRSVATAALAGVLIFGVATFLRILQRNQVTDEYKRILRYLREEMRKRAGDLQEYALPFGRQRHWLLRGGLAVTVALMNSFLVASLATLWTEQAWRWMAVVAFLGSFVLHSFGIQARKGTSTPDDETSQTFRAGAGAIIVNQAGRVLALERRDIPGAWQMPQGGLKIGEDPLEAAKREIREETGIEDADLQLISALDRLLAYELPPGDRSRKTGRGQVQYWFVFRYRGTDERITLGDQKEFVRWKWSSMDDIASHVVAFKKPVYKELLGYFAHQLRSST